MGMFIICLHTKFHILVQCSISYCCQTEAKQKFSHSYHVVLHLIKVYIFLEIYCYTAFQDSNTEYSGVCITPISQVRVSAMLLVS